MKRDRDVIGQKKEGLGIRPDIKAKNNSENRKCAFKRLITG
jgi:hypothetical protein